MCFALLCILCNYQNWMDEWIISFTSYTIPPSAHADELWFFGQD